MDALREHDLAGEVLILDDGSRDGSLTLLRQLEALHFKDGLRVVALGTNRGLAAARNLALERANHGLIVFMDADNELVGENLPLFARAIRATGAAAVFGNLIEPDGPTGDPPGLKSSRPFLSSMYRENHIDAFALVDREQLWDVGAYSDLAPRLEDYELWLHLVANGRRVVFVPAVFGFYHRLPGSMITEPHRAARARARRAHDQLGSRAFLPANARGLAYHPDIGYL